MREPRQEGKPLESIKDKHAESSTPEPPRRSIFQRIALGVVVLVGLAAGLVRRRRTKTAQ
jgi:MYXO-CTERM domain-containing protein